jgi:hypothetical protein
MCLITRQKEAIILSEDKIVYKVLTGDMTSTFFGYTYELNLLNECKIRREKTYRGAFDNIAANKYRLKDVDWSMEDPVEDEKLTAISSGFHAFITKDRAIGYMGNRSDKILYECTIPAGSEYYEDETGLCVSNKIIINKLIY